jgi:hypothetical protein
LACLIQLSGVSWKILAIFLSMVKPETYGIILSIQSMEQAAK